MNPAILAVKYPRNSDNGPPTRKACPIPRNSPVPRFPPRAMKVTCRALSSRWTLPSTVVSDDSASAMSGHDLCCFFCGMSESLADYPSSWLIMIQRTIDPSPPSSTSSSFGVFVPVPDTAIVNDSKFQYTVSSFPTYPGPQI